MLKPGPTVPATGNRGPSAPAKGKADAAAGSTPVPGPVPGAGPSRRRRRPDIRTAIRGVGRTLIAIGVLLFLFVGYQLWGTGIHHSRAQDRLRVEFEQTVLTAPPSLPRPDGLSALDSPPPPPALGDAVAQIQIPRVGVDEYVVQGVEVADLKNGPGHYPDTPLPGEKGNVGIAGHRTTYGAPFYDLNELEPGDPIFVTTAAGRFRYDVTELTVVRPEDSWVLDPTPDDRLTLTTCEPRYSAAKRLIVVAQLVTPPVETNSATPAPAGPTPLASESTDAGSPGAGSGSGSGRSLDAAGLSGESTARTPAVLWGGAAAIVWLGAWFVARRRKAWIVYAASSPVFFFALYNFYENVALLLPANA